MRPLSASPHADRHADRQAARKRERERDRQREKRRARPRAHVQEGEGEGLGECVYEREEDARACKTLTPHGTYYSYVGTQLDAALEASRKSRYMCPHTAIYAICVAYCYSCGVLALLCLLCLRDWDVSLLFALFLFPFLMPCCCIPLRHLLSLLCLRLLALQKKGNTKVREVAFFCTSCS